MQTSALRFVLDHVRRQAGADAVKDLSDAELLERFCGRREEAAFALLLQRHGPTVLGVCRRVLNNDADVEDAFLLLVRKAAAIRRRESVAAWLYRTAYRVALRARQRAAKQSSREASGVEWLGTAAVNAVVWHEVRPILDEEITRLRTSSIDQRFDGPLRQLLLPERGVRPVRCFREAGQA